MAFRPNYRQQRSERDRPKEWGEVVGETQIEVKTLRLGFDVGDGLVFEIVGHWPLG